MTTGDIRTLYDYNRWANQRSLAAAAALAPEPFARELGSSFGSVRGTLTHILGAEWTWLERWQGRSPAKGPAEILAAQTVAELESHWARVEAARDAYLAGLTDHDLAQGLSYRSLAGEPFTNPLGILLQHVVNHGTYHRGQITTLLRQLGAKPQATDLVAYARLHL